MTSRWGVSVSDRFALQSAHGLIQKDILKVGCECSLFQKIITFLKGTRCRKSIGSQKNPSECRQRSCVLASATGGRFWRPTKRTVLAFYLREQQRGRFWCETKSTVLVLGKEDGSDAKPGVRLWCWVKRTVLMLNKEYGSGAGYWGRF